MDKSGKGIINIDMEEYGRILNNMGLTWWRLLSYRCFWRCFTYQWASSYLKKSVRLMHLKFLTFVPQVIVGDPWWPLVTWEAHGRKLCRCVAEGFVQWSGTRAWGALGFGISAETSTAVNRRMIGLRLVILIFLNIILNFRSTFIFYFIESS